MSDLEVLWVILGCLYAWECLSWVPRESVAFSSATGHHWRIRWPTAPLGNRRGGFVLGHPVPPLGSMLLGNPLPLSLSAEGILGYVSTGLHPRGRSSAQSCVCVCFASVESVEASRRQLKVNGRVLLTAASPGLAGYLAEVVRRLRRLPAHERAKAITTLFAASLDRAAIDERWAAFQKVSGALRWLCNGLFVFVFLLAPLTIRLVGLQRCWGALLLGLFALTITTAWFFKTAHRVLYPGADEDRFIQSLTILLAPTSAMRALDTLSLPLLETFHPVAIARVFCPKPAFAALAQTALLDLRHPALPVCPVNESAAAAIERSSREEWVRAIETFLRQNDLDPEKLEQAPPAQDPTCQSYCPRCRSQFVWPAGECSDCGGIPLQPVVR